MRRILTTIALTSLLLAGTALAKEKVYGKGVGEGDITKISTILAAPDEFAGKTVRVEGTAVGVCTHRGCWVTLASDQEEQTMRVKVEDGVIVFPKEIIGEHVTVEGVFTINKVEAKCDATKHGEPEVKCTTFYEIKGAGATVDWK
ncbi:DUF4920 domain-containing protein [bacterium]|nr:DUF4920 domain-containing protein [bacterium]MBU1071753.1 DUF4920 domain-containing protein [bacterium]